MNNLIPSQSIEKVISVGLRLPNQRLDKFQELMSELQRLVETAGGQVVKEMVQARHQMDPGTLLGKGKLQEIAEEVERSGIKTVVFDDDLSAAQQKNIEKIIPAKIVDRTRLILDIFAKRAHTREGQLQVELAQLNYLVPRLTGAWRGFSQQMGGIGTRGPGERKIEVERFYVRERIKKLKKNIHDVREHRLRARTNRQQVPLPQIALVGYTNVGKSTLLNAFTGKERGLYADDKLFATLDPTTRRVKLPGGQNVLFTDTVGFIQKLPHDLIAAFRATLEEVVQANLLVHVVDATDEYWSDHQNIALDVIKELGADHIPLLTVFNKIDRLSQPQRGNFQMKGNNLISGHTKEGVSAFLTKVEQQLDEAMIEVSFELPHARRHLLYDIYRIGRIVSEQATETGTQLQIRIDPGNWKRISHQLDLGSTS